MNANEKDINSVLSHMCREVKEYNPNDYMIALTDKNGNPSQYLTVAHRKDWFFRWCQQEGLVGYIDEGEPEYDAQLRQLVTEAKIFVNGTVIGSSRGGKPFNPQMPETCSPTILQEVTTLAVGRALANCGFGTVGAIEDRESVNSLSDAPVVNMQESQIPAGVPVPSSVNPVIAQATSSEHPYAAPNEVTPSNTADTDEASLIASLKTAAQLDISPVTSLAAARAITMPFGEFKGFTLGEIATSHQDGVHKLNKLGRQMAEKKCMPNLAQAIRVVANHARK